MVKLYLNSASSGLYSCPLVMTDGAAKIVETLKDSHPWLYKKAFPRLMSSSPAQFWTSGQWMTEKKGGSDIGSQYLDEVGGQKEQFVPTKSYHEAHEVLRRSHFVILTGKAGDGKSTIARKLVNTFLDAELVDYVVFSESPQDLIQCDKGQKQLIIIEDIFKNHEAVVDLGPVFDSILKMLNEDYYSNTYVVMTSRSNEYVCSMPDLRLLEEVEIKATRKERIEIFLNYYRPVCKWNICWLEHLEKVLCLNLQHTCMIKNDDVDLLHVPANKMIADTKMIGVNEQNDRENITDRGMFDDYVIVTRPHNLMTMILSGIPSVKMLSILIASENRLFREPGYLLSDLCVKTLGRYSRIQTPVMEENWSGWFSESTYAIFRAAKFPYLETVSIKVYTLLCLSLPEYRLKSDFYFKILCNILRDSIGDVRFVPSEIPSNVVYGGVIDVPEDVDKVPDRTKKSETNSGVIAERMVIKLKTKSEGEFGSMALSGQRNNGEQNMFPSQIKEDSDLSRLPNFDIICGDENTPNLDEELIDKSFSEVGEYRNSEKNRHLCLEVSDSHESSVQVPPGVTDVDTSSKGEGKCTNSDRNDKVPENEVELKETEETDNNKKLHGGDIESISEDMAKPISLDALRWKDAGNICTVRIEREMKLNKREKVTVKNKMKWSKENWSGNLDNDNHLKDAVYDKVKSLIVSKQDLSSDKLGTYEKINDRNQVESNEQALHHMLHESSLQEEAFESSKDRLSLLRNTKDRNWPFIGADFTVDSYCISSENAYSEKKGNHLINNQKKVSNYPFRQFTDDSLCKSTKAETGSCCQSALEVFEEMLRKMTDSLQKQLDQKAKDIQDSIEDLRKSTLVAKVSIASSRATNSSHSSTKSDDENNVYVSSHVRMDYDTLLDQKLDIELEENDSETRVKQRDTSSQELSMQPLKLWIISEKDGFLGDEQEFSSSSDARKLSLSEADEIASSYPETMSCFQGRSNVRFDDSLIESYTQMNTVPDNHSDEECEVYSDKSLSNGGASVTESLDDNEQNAVPNAFPGQEENWSDDGIFSNDEVIEDNEILQSVRYDICNSLDKVIEKSSSITCHKTDPTIEPIKVNTDDSLTMCLSVDPNETEISSMSANHDLQNEVPKYETRHRDFLEEGDSYRENTIIDSVVDGTSIEEEVLEDFSISFSQEVMKEFEISIERNGLLQRRRNGMSKGIGIKESETYFIANAGNDEYLEHENHPEKEDTAQTAASIEKRITCDTITPIFGDDGELCDSVSSEKECVDRDHFGTMSESQGNKEDSFVADLCSYCFSTCCIPCDSYEGPGNVGESLSSDTSTEYFRPTVLKSRLHKQRTGKTRRILRHRPGTVKPSEMEESVAYLVPALEKRNRKIRKRCQENRYQRKMHSEYSTQLSMNDRMNGSKQNKKKEVRSLLRHKRHGTRVGQGDEITRIDKSANLGTFYNGLYEFYNSLYESNERPASSIQRKYLFTAVDVKHENVRNELCNDQTGHGQEYGKLQYQVIEDVDSGIFSSLMSARYSILKEHDRFMKSLSSKGRDRKKKSRKSHRELDRLDSELNSFLSELNSFLRSLERIVERKVTNDAVAFPGLQQYFESLNDGQTPSLQEQMPYEWLRLMSFSNYTGGGSPVHLARNGFYHSHNNETRCFSCNISHAGWTYSDNVQEVHRRISPNCRLVNGGIESSGNISIESGTRENQPSQAPANLDNGTGVRQGASQLGYSTERPAISANHGSFAFGNAPRLNFSSQSTNTTATSAPTFSFNPPVTRQDPSEFRFPQTSNQLPSGVPNLMGQSAAAVTTSGATAFSFSAAANTPEPAGFRLPQSTSQQTGGSDLTSQLRALTIQQSTGIQQPSDEPISGNPVIAPTQPLQIARQADGDTQLSISAQLPPETSDLPQTTTSNQRPSEPSGSAPPAQRTENADLIQITQLKHPRYSTMAVRMSSFRSWPNYLNQTARQMAYAGFFHPGVADFARCFCCGGGLRNWEADDDPMVEHARWYPRCEYINKLKGTHFVQAVLRRHREHMAERQREQETAQNTFSTPDPMSTSVAANLLEMGFTQERAREAILTVRRLRERSEVSIEEVTAWMLDDGNAPQQDPAGTDITAGPGDAAGNAPPQPPRSQTPASSGSSSFESAVAARQDSDGHGSIEDSQGGRSNSLGSTREPHGATGVDMKEDKPPKDKPSKTDSSSDEKGKDYSSDDKSKKDKVPDEKKPKSKKDKKSKSRKGRRSPVSGEGAAAAEVDTKSLKEENKLLKQMQVCKICMDKYVSVTFLPCGHLVCCEDCAKNMRKCPICRKRIKGQVRTFMS